MTRYNIFLSLFLLSVITCIALMIFYFSAIYSLVLDRDSIFNEASKPDPGAIISTFFNPGLLISLFLFATSSLVLFG
jgi:hypothetical protein